MKTIKKQIILRTAITAFTLISTICYAQKNSASHNNFTRDGFMFEFGLGGGVISIEDSGGLRNYDDSQGGGTFPELKFGYMLNNNLAITVSLPGMIYTLDENDRDFGGIIPSVQYWIKDRWWLHGGAGLAIDSPALYDIKENVNDDWNTGIAAMVSTGYEVYRKNKFALNVQSKLLVGGVKLNNDIDREVVQFSLGIGFSWF
ncbi:hypothetical protein NYZ99_16545 [Maribacter litopenaei]|uniref:Outer membrane protein beta-barrel domain-containing protein n=1 Tax=Maribacter litopenaei TaxID=2976127 RepID=A0ABY5Y668_9FLAO|nr:hypothetical protein [Maribacter litopenaei]UWX54503.1 hypothetical protein NYZ99_16545 [Maribacter litopenaei]